MTDLRDDLAYVIGDTATERAFAALLAHAAREDVLNRAAKEFCAQAGFGWDKRTDDNKARLRECAKAALAAFLQDGENPMTDLPVMSAVALDATAEAMVKNAPSISYTAWTPVMQALRAEVARLREAAEWRPIETYKGSAPVIVRTERGRVFKAKLVHFDDVVGWGTEEEDDPRPSCWTDGVCWQLNEDEEPSDPPTHWKPLSPPQVEEGR